MKFLNKVLGRWVFKFITKKIGNMKGSWKTTTLGWVRLGIGVLGAVIALILGEELPIDPIVAALGSVGLSLPGWLQGLLSRDDEKSSEDVGVK